MPERVEARWRAVGALALVTSFAAVSACSSDVAVGVDDPKSSGGQPGQGGQGGATASGGGPSATGGMAGAAACIVAECQGKTYDCGNCKDDDADGLIDALDPDCLGPCDNTEDSFYGGIPGQSGGGCRQDCYFDQDSGSGNDGCEWTHACDPLSVAPNYPPSGDTQCAYDENASVQGRLCAALQTEQPAACLDYCETLTPKGCDCFGCCELPARSGKFVWLGSSQGGTGSCTRDKLSDPDACRPCTQVASCSRPCGACDVCAGETSPDPNCGQPPACDFGLIPCGPGASCAAQYYCISGCCAPVPR